MCFFVLVFFFTRDRELYFTETLTLFLPTFFDTEIGGRSADLPGGYQAADPIFSQHLSVQSTSSYAPAVIDKKQDACEVFEMLNKWINKCG